MTFLVGNPSGYKYIRAEYGQGLRIVCKELVSYFLQKDRNAVLMDEKFSDCQQRMIGEMKSEWTYAMKNVGPNEGKML